jgi:hypothetical protein
VTGPDTPTERVSQVGFKAATPTADSGAPPPDLEERLRATLAPNLLLVRALGAGGMGSVFLAREPALKRTVAVKVLAPELAASPEARARFEREAQAVAVMSHPNVVAVHSVGELADGTPWFAMQYVAGRSLATRLAEDGPLSVAETRKIIGEVASALAAAHAKGIIHRDIKPANILNDEESGRALVSDFGIAAVTPPEGDADTRLTKTGMIVGTPQYMSPEQLLAEPLSEKTDTYALGLVGYELLVGKGPFDATTPHELIAAHLRDVPRRLSDLREDVDAETESLIASCLEKDPAKRPTAAALAQRLSPGAGAPLEWPPPGLERLRGLTRTAVRRTGSGSLLLLGGTIPLLLAGPRFSSATVSALTLLLLLAAVAGLVALVAAARTAAVLGAEAGRAVRAGFAWLTVLETCADARGDTGQLIAGAGAFAALPPERRNGLRRLRLIRQLAILLAAALPLPLLLGVFLAGSAGWGGPRVVWLALAVPALAALVAHHVGALERGAVEHHRSRRKRLVTRPDLSRLAGPWYQTFETVRHGQSMGRGPAGPPGLGWGGALALMLIVAVVVMVGIPIVLVGTVGPAYWTIATPRFANTKEKAAIAEPTRAYGVPRDSSITPLEAGRAFAILGGSRSSDRLPMQPLPAPESLPWQAPLPEGLFPGARPRAFDGPDHLAILQAAVRGFSPAELAYLERLAHLSMWRHFSTVARATRMDGLGGQFIIPFPDSVTKWELPIPRFRSTMAYAYAAASRAAYHLALGQRDSAETALRETISFGFAMLDNAPSLTDALIGVVIVGVGHANLVQLYTLTGNPAGARLRASHDSAIAFRQDRPAAETDVLVNWNDAEVVRRMMARAAGNPREMRALRIELLGVFGVAPCTNARELLFGPDRDMRDLFEQARRELARFPSESSLVDLMATMPERMRFVAPDGAAQRAAASLGRLAGALLMNPRIPGCTWGMAAVRGSM